MRRAMFRGFALSLACAFSVAAGTAQAADTSVTPRTYNVWQWNVAGNTIHDGSLTDGLVEQAVDSIVNRGADFAAFNELCQNQYSAIITELRARAWPVDGNTSFARFEPSLPAGDPDVCAGSAYGNALFSRHPLGSADRVTLPTDGAAEARNLLCAPLADGSGTVFCTTHLTTDPDYKSTQLKAVFDQLATYDTPIIAGDFNVQPHHKKLNPYYAPSVNTVANDGNTGSYRELDDADSAHCPGHGESTTDAPSDNKCGIAAKIDLVFVRESTLAGPYSADSLAPSTACTGVAACSDHRVLIGTVTVQ
ncbi:endonuclease/exonuclease/phosphatase family protein [Streptomyces wedmorensis]